MNRSPRMVANDLINGLGFHAAARFAEDRRYLTAYRQRARRFWGAVEDAVHEIWSDVDDAEYYAERAEEASLEQHRQP